jgi:hypothetical protein
MPLISPPSGTIAPGSQFPQLLYGPNGLVVTVWTEGDVMAAEQAGFDTTPDPAHDYGWMRAATEVSYSSFNYSSIEVAGRPWNWGDADPRSAKSDV